MEQSPQNPGAPAQDSTVQASAVQGSHLPENTVQSNAVQENTVQNNAAESTTVEATAAPTATAIQSPEQDPALADTASVAPAEAVAPPPQSPSVWVCMHSYVSRLRFRLGCLSAGYL